MTMTPDRAKNVVAKQRVFPYWGNYQKFMTPDEITHVKQLWKADPNGSVTFACIVNRIAQSG